MQAALSVPPAGPTAASERVEVLDVLRGFALYGVLLANTVQWFSGRAFSSRAVLRAQRDTIDHVFLFLMNLLVGGKAMTLLTLLFGLGFSLQLRRAELGKRSVVPTFLRRLAALTLIGVCHVLLLWWGDILWGYALAGVGLVLFRRVRGWRLLAWALGLALVPQFVAALLPVSKALALVLAKPDDPAAFRAQLLAAITGHDRWILTTMHVKQVYYHVGGVWVWYLPWLLGRFLLGYWAGTIGIFLHGTVHLPFFRRLARWGLGLGFAGSAIPAVDFLLSRRNVTLPESALIALSIPTEVGVLLLTAGYVAAVVLLMQRPAWRRALRLVAPVGQMALTTYLGQSLLCTALFYGWGLGLAGRVSPAQLLPITLAVFLLQIVIAHLWLVRFRFGPMEWLWRSLTYGRAQPLRRAG